MIFTKGAGALEVSALEFHSIVRAGLKSHGEIKLEGGCRIKRVSRVPRKRGGGWRIEIEPPPPEPPKP